jgi:hypothetical protein
MEMTKNDKAFVEYVKAHCKELGIKCDLRPTHFVYCGSIKCAGYFDSDSNMLVVSMKHKDALGVLVHEYCHLTQWQDGIELWSIAGNALNKVEDWLKGKRVRNIATHLAHSRDLELDNERRSVKMMKKWKLTIDVDDYIRKANAYVHFYNWMHHSRTWSKPGNAPYTNKVVLSTMSSKFNMRYDQLPRKVYNAFHAEKI